MVSEKKIESAQEMENLLKQYSTIGILNMHGMPARQLREIRIAIRNQAKIKVAKANIIRIAMKSAGKDVEKLGNFISGEVAMLFSNENPVKLYRLIESNKSPAKGKPGDVSEIDIIIPSGQTQFAAGPIISEFQKAKIKTTVEGGKISVKEDTMVAKKGDKLTKELCDFISKFGIEPVNITLNVVSMLENGIVFSKEVLSVPLEKYLGDLLSAHMGAVNLSVGVGYPNKESVKIMIRKARDGAKTLGVERNILEKETVGSILGKAKAQADALKGLFKGG